MGLQDWSAKRALTYTANSKELFSSGRIDSQFFRPTFKVMFDRLASLGNSIPLGGILDVNRRGKQPTYSDIGTPVINSKHVRKNKVVLTGNRYAEVSENSILIEQGDVLINGTGEGTLGRAAPYLHVQSSIPDNHVTVLRSKQIDPIYLSVFLNSILGQLQIERHIKGSSGQIEIYPTDIEQIVVWIAPDKIQQSIRRSILSVFQSENLSARLLEIAKKSVEIAIEHNEIEALNYLNREAKNAVTS